MSSSTSNVTISKTSTIPTTTVLPASDTSNTFTSTNPTTSVSTVSATSNTSTSTNDSNTSTSTNPTSIRPTTVLPANDTNNTSTSTKSTTSVSTVSATRNNSTSTNASNTSTSMTSATAGPTATTKTNPDNNGTKSINSVDIKVIVPAVVVPCGLLIIGAIILLVVLCVRRRARKNVRESPDGIDVQDKGNNIDGWKQSLGHGKATDNLDAVYTTRDGFIIYPGPAAISTARSYKDKKYLDVTDQYSRPDPGTYGYQAAYIPSTYTSARSYTHKDKKGHGVTDPYSRPYTGAYGYQAAYVPSTYTSARTYPHKGKIYDYEGPIGQRASHVMAASRPAYDQAAYYPKTGHYGHSGEDVYYSGGGQYSYGQSSRSHYDHNGRKQQREYYNQYEMADYRGDRTGYRHTKQNTAFYY